MERALLLSVLAVFSALSAVALWQHGYWGIFEPLFRSSAGAQVLADIVIALGLAIVWMVHDARATGRTVWPFVVVTLAVGSFGPLLYLLTRPRTPVAA
ncbi:DUF2834 domain-containing protein [Chthonobacter rhizosphaerae]|uniref:DUF2834 domain-containing protein n=1 Tax=Chthonobacter rhizosphaerae TaxID=2735553 RepID=UPI0015EE718E|nr:DUF2834 domain-containing protein [Chthonobacter rhizosphaerae]